MTAAAEIDDQVQLQRTDEQVHCVVDGSVVVMTLADGNYFELNPVGARIWDELAAPRRLPELVATLLEDYNIDEATCRVDVSQWLSQMLDLGLIAPC